MHVCTQIILLVVYNIVKRSLNILSRHSSLLSKGTNVVCGHMTEMKETSEQELAALAAARMHVQHLGLLEALQEIAQRRPGKRMMFTLKILISLRSPIQKVLIVVYMVARPDNENCSSEAIVKSTRLSNNRLYAWIACPWTASVGLVGRSGKNGRVRRLWYPYAAL